MATDESKSSTVGVESQPQGERRAAVSGEDSKKWAQLVAQAWSDEQLKQRLIAKPVAVLHEHGINVPAGTEIRVVENTDKVAYLILPPQSADSEAPRTAQQEDRKKWLQFLAQVRADVQLKQRLLHSPAAVLEEHGIPVPAGLDVRVVENTHKVSYLTLPPVPSDSELTSSQLGGVAGGNTTIGITHFHCTVESWVDSYCDTNVYNYLSGWMDGRGV